MKPEIRKHLEEMRQLYIDRPYEELEKINWEELPEVNIKGEVVLSAVWSEKQPTSELLFVVQLTKQYPLKFIKITNCIGFLITPAGDITLVDENYLMNEADHP